MLEQDRNYVQCDSQHTLFHCTDSIEKVNRILDEGIRSYSTVKPAWFSGISPLGEGFGNFVIVSRSLDFEIPIFAQRLLSDELNDQFPEDSQSVCKVLSTVEGKPVPITSAALLMALDNQLDAGGAHHRTFHRGVRHLKPDAGFRIGLIGPNQQDDPNANDLTKAGIPYLYIQEKDSRRILVSHYNFKQVGMPQLFSYDDFPKLGTS